MDRVTKLAIHTQEKPNNIFEFFDRTRIINLASRNDRKRETESEFKRYGFQINTEKVAFFNAISPDSAEGFPNCGCRGGFLSHMEVLENAETSGLNNILVLEDDICFSKHILEYGQIAINALKDLDWDIAYFGHALDNSPDEIGWKETKKPMQLAHFYAINGKALAEFVRCLHQILERPPGHPDGGPMYYDGALNTFRMQNPKIKSYYFSINLAYQRPSRTDQHAVSFFDKHRLFMPMTSFFRQVKNFYLRTIR